MFFTDVHNHLQDPQFAGDFPEVLQRAKTVGVRRFVINGTEPGDWAKTRNIAENYDGIAPCFGLHPWFLGEIGDPAREIESLEFFLDHTKCRDAIRPGLGEIGLDFYRDIPDRELQERVFRTQLRIAKLRELPIMLHTIGAMSAVEPILEQEGPFPLVLFHGFSGPTDRIGSLVKINGYFSFSAVVLSSRNRRVRAAACAVPSDRILLESDAPALAPDRNRRNEPSILPLIARELAALRGTSEEQMCSLLEENSQRFWKIFET